MVIKYMENLMRSKLEEKLADFEKSSPISNDKELIKALNKIIDETVPVDESDVEIIDEAVEMLFELEGVDMGAVKQAAEECSTRYLKDRGINHNILTVSALEAKLCKIDANNDQELKVALNKIIDNTVPENEKDLELIDEAVEMLLTLDGVDTAELDKAADACGERYLASRKTTHDYTNINTSVKRKRSIRIKKLIPLVAVMCILLFAILGSCASGIDLIDFFDEKLFGIDLSTLQSDSDVAVNIAGSNIKYDSYQELLDSKNIEGILWPHNYSKYIESDKICFDDYGDYQEITVNFSIEKCVLKIKVYSSADYSEKNTVKIGEYDVYITEYDGIHQGEFVFHGIYYRVIADTYENLTLIIGDME